MNDTEKSIEDLVRKLSKLNLARIAGYISHVRFPNFKGLERNLRIDLGFPVTALVGPNGSGKSSVLHALYGMPIGQSASDFYFSTQLDPNDSKAHDSPRYIYGTFHSEFKKTIEIRKARVFRKSRGYEYFEPTKRVDIDNMDAMPDDPFDGKDVDRWNPIQKPVVYVNSKLTIGAFERAMAFKPEGENKTDGYQRLLRAAQKLQIVFAGGALTYMGPKKALLDRFKLEAEEIDFLAKILGRTYSEVECLQHMFFAGQKYSELTARFCRGDEANRFLYSDFLAGSGELSAVRIVHQVFKSQDNSLVLLDEPETCLHPGAQRELLNFLLAMAEKKNLQIVFTTHSPELIKKLPRSAIKVFQEHSDGKFGVMQEVESAVAFNRLGVISSVTKQIFVEDALSKAIVESALRLLDKTYHSIQVYFRGGGFEWLLGKFIPSNLQHTNILVLLDGDVLEKKPFFKVLPKPEELTISDLTNAWLKSNAGVGIDLPKNGGSGGAQNIEHERALVSDYLRWCRKNLRFLPGGVPENIALSILESKCSDLAASEAKTALSERMDQRGILNQSELAGAIKQSCFSLDRQENVALGAVRDQIESWLNGN